MDIKIDSETINKMVSDAILKSVIGDTIAKQVDEAVAGLAKTYDSPLKKIINTEVCRIATSLINERYKEAIEAKILEVVASETTDKIVKAIVDKAFDGILSDRY